MILRTSGPAVPMIHVLEFISLSLANISKASGTEAEGHIVRGKLQRQSQPNIGHAADAILIVICKVRSRSLDEACELERVRRDHAGTSNGR
jgi:hypothetical protein